MPAVASGAGRAWGEIVVFSGSQKTLQFSLKDSNGAAVPILGGDTFQLWARNTRDRNDVFGYGDVDFTVSGDGTAGILSVVLQASDTLHRFGFSYDLQLWKTSTNNPIGYGVLRILKSAISTDDAAIIDNIPSGIVGMVAATGTTILAANLVGATYDPDTNTLTVAGGSGSGDVVGPSSAVANHVAIFNGTSGKIIKDSGLLLSGTNTGDQTTVSGNAGTATKLATARNIVLSGAVTGSASFDGSANSTIAATINSTLALGGTTAAGLISAGTTLTISAPSGIVVSNDTSFSGNITNAGSILAGNGIHVLDTSGSATFGGVIIDTDSNLYLGGDRIRVPGSLTIYTNDPIDPTTTLVLDETGNATVLGSIQANNLTGTNTGNQNLFGSIVVSGQTTVTPASTSQALTLVGSGVTITTDNSTKTITFTATGGGSGDVTGPASAADGNLVLFNGTSGKIIKEASATLPSVILTSSVTKVGTLASPVMVTPTLGAAIGTSLSLSGAITSSGGTATNLTMVTPTLGAAIGTSLSLSGALTATGGTHTSPTFVTPVLGAATGTSVSLSGAITATGGTLTNPVMVTPTLGAAIGTSLSVSGGIQAATTTLSGLTGSLPVVANSSKVLVSIATPTQMTFLTGTAYSLTATSAAIVGGTTSPTVTITDAGTYRVEFCMVLSFNGATFAADKNVTLKLRRTNNTAADLTSGTMPALHTGVVTTFTSTWGSFVWVAADYTATAADVVTVFGDVATVPSAGSLDVTGGFIRITRLY